MTTNVLTRWEELRPVFDGPKKHRQHVEAWLQTRPAIVWYGDSWFSTPLYKNLARQSAEAIDGLRLIAGTPGALAAKLFSPSAAKNLCGRLAGDPWDVLCLSAGGNDALSDRLEKVYAPWMKGNKAKLSPEAAFDLLLESKLFDRMRDRYATLLDLVASKVHRKRPHFRVIGHTYAPLRRIGAAGDLTIGNIGLLAILKDDVGPWLYGPMKRVLASKADGAVFARRLLQQGFRDRVMKACAKDYGAFFSFVDLGAVDLADDALWYDEIHPTEGGFQRFIPAFNGAIRAALPAQKRGAVGG
jgi:hypothetical protein